MKNLILSDKTYSLLKWVALILLPALGTLYFALASIWGLPFGEQNVGTITAVDTFLLTIIRKMEELINGRKGQLS